MLRVAIPNKGILSESAISMLKEAGYQTRRDTQELHLVDSENNIEFFYLRPRDIATYVGSGSLDVGLTGLDLLMDSESAAEEIADLDFGQSTFRFAASVEAGFKQVSDLEGKRLATAYPTLIANYLSEQGVSCEIVKLDGAVESAVKLGVADAVADVVSTGNTLRKAGLSIFGPTILRSTARLIAAPGKAAEANQLLMRLKGVLVARQYVIIDYDCPIDLVEKASLITPGIESPTISPLADKDWVAVRALVLASKMNQIMDELYAVGARAILVSAIHAARI
ncbi:MAG: ATP phosphoribosyltransferase [Micrococcales bacterium]|jgi:ATP phosphoribosyltransferase|nr:ATP phosphoribosyltransferase [Micrococcales bacterium]